MDDFNSIRNLHERKLDSSFQRHGEMRQFDEFIANSEAINLPLVGRNLLGTRWEDFL